MIQEFYFLRHGETDWNVERRCQGQLDIPLNDHGKNQAKIIQSLIKDLPITKCVSSDLSRALETAKIALHDSAMAIEATPLLRERHFGNLQGQLFNEIEKQVGPSGMVEDPTIETDDAMWERWQKISLQPNNTLFVTHGGFIRVVLNKLGLTDQKIKNVALYKLMQIKNQKWAFDSLS